MNLFVYGTLMIPSVMYTVTARRFPFADAILKGYARYRVKGESYPGIIPAAEAVTEGIICFGVDEISLKRLDEFEGDLYQRNRIMVETKKGETYNAETYAIRSEYISCLSSEKWNLKDFSRNYLDAFLESYSGFQKKL